MVNTGVEPNVHTYGALIDGCARAGQVAKAFGVYGIMRSKVWPQILSFLFSHFMWSYLLLVYVDIQTKACNIFYHKAECSLCILTKIRILANKVFCAVEREARQSCIQCTYNCMWSVRSGGSCFWCAGRNGGWATSCRAWSYYNWCFDQGMCKCWSGMFHQIKDFLLLFNFSLSLSS